jgi:hypothetical protein
MKVTIQHPEKKYPYLAVWTGGDPLKPNYEIADIMVVSIQPRTDKDNVIYVQSLTGKSVGHETKNEHEYQPLPAGTKIEITQ